MSKTKAHYASLRRGRFIVRQARYQRLIAPAVAQTGSTRPPATRARPRQAPLRRPRRANTATATDQPRAGGRHAFDAVAAPDLWISFRQNNACTYAVTPMNIVAATPCIHTLNELCHNTYYIRVQRWLTGRWATSLNSTTDCRTKCLIHPSTSQEMCR